jgi:hypothetical protein
MLRVTVKLTELELTVLAVSLREDAAGAGSRQAASARML